MKPLDVVNVIEERTELGSRFLKVVVLAEVHLLFLERLEEALCFGIIVGTTRLAHAGTCPDLTQAGNVLATCILNAPIRMMDQARTRTAGGNRVVQRHQRQARVNVFGQVPADHAAAEAVQDAGQVHKALRQANIGHVHHPNLI